MGISPSSSSMLAPMSNPSIKVARRHYTRPCTGDIQTLSRPSSMLALTLISQTRVAIRRWIWRQRKDMGTLPKPSSGLAPIPTPPIERAGLHCTRQCVQGIQTWYRLSSRLALTFKLQTRMATPHSIWPLVRDTRQSSRCLSMPALN